MFMKSMAANIVFEMLMLGFFFTFALVLQIGLGYSPLEAALAGIPTAIGITVTMVALANYLLPRIGRYAMSLGTVVMSLGLWLTYVPMQAHGRETQPLELSLGLFLVGVGMGLIMVTVFSNALRDVDTKHAGSASGTMNAIQQLGGAIGIAAIGVIFFGQLTTNAAASFDSVDDSIKSSLTKAGVPAQAQDQIVASSKTCFVDRTSQKNIEETPESCKQLSDQPQNPASKAIGETIQHAALEANTKNFVSAYHMGIVYAWGLAAVCFVMSFMFPRKIAYDATGH
jgi:hypothetical protein